MRVPWFRLRAFQHERKVPATLLAAILLAIVCAVVLSTGHVVRQRRVAIARGIRDSLDTIKGAELDVVAVPRPGSDDQDGQGR